MKRLLFAVLTLILAGTGFATRPALASGYSGEHTLGQATIEPAYDDSTGSVVYLLTPNRLAPLSPTNPINTVNQHAAAPLYIIVYPPGTPGTFNCMGVPGNCPDHDGVISGVATGVEPNVYGTNPSAVPGHDHLVGVANTGGDFNVPWHVYVELFTSNAKVRHITTLSDLKAAWADGTIFADGGQGIDTGITFACSVVSQAAYDAGAPVS
ncbi:MAG TPA: hypothetical protein DEV93_22020 [Chloroflexi bacterium]|jgi:hypothetical protein|nr:hypothetical protein [Chloroflexota bacterium]